MPPDTRPLPVKFQIPHDPFPVRLLGSQRQMLEPRHFMELLPLLGLGSRTHFFDLAVQSHQISLNRPFYPFRPGRCDLQLMSSVNDVSGIPTAGKSLNIVAAVKNVLHFHIFDNDGRMDLYLMHNVALIPFHRNAL